MAKKSSVKHVKRSNEGFIDTLNDWFNKAPSLPKSWRTTLVRIAPWLALIFGILGVIVAISSLGLLAAASPFAAISGALTMSEIGGGFFTGLIWLLASVLMVAAFPGTKARKTGGWNLLFWSEVVYLIGSIVALSLVSGIIGAFIAFYLLFQIRPYYK